MMNYLYTIYNYFFPKTSYVMPLKVATHSTMLIVRVNYNIIFNHMTRTIKYTYNNITHYIYDKLRKKYDTDNNIIYCDICMINKKNIALIPCGHLLCLTCKTNLFNCHICRSKIYGYITIYL